ncbi:MAG: PilZ domain-containing protein [Chthoniobacterales bacterium]|nr:PilZ domain-containing protein [Chthoniobacterales bacterium]
MTTLHEWKSNKSETKTAETANAETGKGEFRMKIAVESDGAERREHRRHDLEMQSLTVDRWDGSRGSHVLGQLVDLSSGGVRIRTEQANIKPDNQIRVRLELPVYAGISPFVDMQDKKLQPKREWIGWMAVTRVKNVESNKYDVAGKLVDMEEMDRGMLGLYLSTQPLAA